MNAGLDRVDSYATNPHKWMGVNFDCTLFWLADRAALVRALSILPEFLRTAASESGAVVDYRGLADPARPAVPGPQAVVRAPRPTASARPRP